MSRFDKLQKMGLNGNNKVTLSLEDGQDIVHYTGEDYEGETIRESGIANSLACLITSRHLPNNTAIEELRNDGYLDDYERAHMNLRSMLPKQLLKMGMNWAFWRWIRNITIISEGIPMLR